jgi:hypothetical protein
MAAPVSFRERSDSFPLHCGRRPYMAHRVELLWCEGSTRTERSGHVESVGSGFMPAASNHHSRERLNPSTAHIEDDPDKPDNVRDCPVSPYGWTTWRSRSIASVAWLAFMGCLLDLMVVLGCTCVLRLTACPEWREARLPVFLVQGKAAISCAALARPGSGRQPATHGSARAAGARARGLVEVAALDGLAAITYLLAAPVGVSRPYSRCPRTR